jgi:integrase
MALSVFIFARKSYLAKKGGTARIYLGIIVNGKNKAPLPLAKNIRVKPEHWQDHDTEGNRLEVPRAMKTCPDQSKINTAILDALAKARKIIERYQVNEWVLTYERFIKEWGGIRADNFEAHLKDYLERMKDVYSDETLTKVTFMMGKFIRWRPNLDLQDIDYKLITQYQQHLLMPKDKGGRGNDESTVYTNLKEFRKIMKDAFNQDLIRRNPFDLIRLHKPKVEKIPLEMDEVQEFEKLLTADLPYYLRKTLCWWLLAIYTGRRYGDLQKFYEWDIRKEYIKVIQQKKVKGLPKIRVVMIFMNERIRSIIDIIIKSRFEPLGTSKANIFLKELASRAGVTKHVYFHLARHTFNHINKKLQTDLNTRKDLMGHDSTKSTLVYERPLPEQMQEAMLKWNNL